jgi:hypothetical protein
MNDRFPFALVCGTVFLLVLLFARHYLNSIHDGDDSHAHYPTVCLPPGYTQKVKVCACRRTRLTIEQNFTLIVWVPARPYREPDGQVLREHSCHEFEVVTTDLVACLTAADVVVFHLMSSVALAPTSLLKKVTKNKGRRPAEHEPQVWIGLSYEASDWVPDKSFVHNDSGVAVLDYLFVHENRQLLTHWDLTPFPNSLPTEERTHDALLLVSNCGPTPSKREELLRFLVSGYVRKHDVRLESLGECWRARNATWPIAASHNDTNRWAPDWDRKKVLLLQQFKFEIIMQNAICPYYIDEKLPLALVSREMRLPFVCFERIFNRDLVLYQFGWVRQKPTHECTNLLT